MGLEKISLFMILIELDLFLMLDGLEKVFILRQIRNYLINLQDIQNQT